MPVIKFLLGKTLRLRVVLHSGKCDRRLSEELQEVFGMDGFELGSLTRDRNRQELFSAWLQEQKTWEMHHLQDLLHPLIEQREQEDV